MAYIQDAVCLTTNAIQNYRRAAPGAPDHKKYRGSKMVDIAKLEELVFYAVDRSSPFPLKLEQHTNTLEKIAKYEFAELEMTSSGIADMWQNINTYAKSYAGGHAVAAADQKKCKKVADVWKAVCKSAGLDAAALAVSP
jgi:hypothetical protein